jgi:hypothetical protein
MFTPTLLPNKKFSFDGQNNQDSTKKSNKSIPIHLKKTPMTKEKTKNAKTKLTAISTSPFA